MANDWIKMRTDLYRDPKVCIIADALMSPDGELAAYVSQIRQRDMSVTRNVMRNVTVGALVALWGVTRHRGKRDGDDLVLRNATLSVCDDIADLPGLGQAMAIVGWATETNAGVVFPGFFGEFNADPAADAKAKAAERQRRYRAKRNVTGDVTVTSQSNAREEKRREENKGEGAASGSCSPPSSADDWDVPSRLDTPEVRTLLDRFAAMRKRIKKPIRSKADASTVLKRFDSVPHLVFALETCIGNDYQGLKPEYRPSQTAGSHTNGNSPISKPLPLMPPRIAQ